MQEDNHFEDQWRKAFENSSELPRPLIWEQIERRLDDDEAVAVPFWKNILRTTAFLFLLLGMLAIGYHYLNNNNLHEVLSKKNEQKGVPEIKKMGTNDNVLAIQNDNLTNEKVKTKTVLISNEQKDRQDKKLVQGVQVALQETKQYDFGMSMVPEKNVHEVENQANKLSAIPEQAIEILYLENKNCQDLLEPAESELLIPMPKINDIVRKEQKSIWIDFGATAGYFNPNVSLPPTNSWLPANYAFATLSNRDTNTGNHNLSGQAFSYHVNIGIPISARLEFETGIGYLKGSSKYETTIWTVDAQQSGSFEGALRNTTNVVLQNNVVASLQDLKQASAASSAQAVASSKWVYNNYEFIQIPLLLNYQLLSSNKKANLLFIGGITNSIFMQNKIETVNGNEIVEKPKSGLPYSMVSFWATFGLKGKYNISNKLSATVSVNYQNSIQSISKSDIYFSAKPQFYGLGLGLEYQFWKKIEKTTKIQ